MAEPLLHAGPILRRVEPRLVCVWVALDRPGALLLNVFDGRQQAGTAIGSSTGGAPRLSGAANTLRVGERLHLGLVVAELPADAPPMLSGQNFTYNLAFGPFVPQSTEIGSQAAVLRPQDVRATADLRTLGLLRDSTAAERPHKALGYDEGELPGFALAPAELTDLRILHGGCRRPRFSYPDLPGDVSYDGLAWVDDLIGEWRRGGPGSSAFDPNTRPHQLFLTGDQIYADDVSAPMLPMLNRVGNDLLGRVELLPTRYPPVDRDPEKEAYLGAPLQPGFDTLEAFFDAMDEAGKDPLEELKRDRRVRFLHDPCLDRRYNLVYGHQPRFAVDPGLPLLGGLRHWPADLTHFPAALRRPVLECEARLTSDDLASHLISFAEYCAMYLAVSANVVWPLTGDRPTLSTAGQVYALPAGRLPQIWEMHACFPDADECVARTDTAGLNEQLGKLRDRKTTRDEFRRDTETLNAFYDSLPRVRRALANIPTYMVFDDHDVTDDWNIGRAWRDQVHTAPLGRRIITSGLLAYALFQDWGNEPRRYRDGAYRDLLVQTSLLFPVGTDPVPALGPVERLAALFGLNQPEPEPAPEIRWHHTIDGPRHRVVLLDTRTRRHYRSRYAAAGLLSEDALNQQLPDPAQSPLPAGIEVLVVVSQTPVGQPTVASALIVPLLTRLPELMNRKKWRNLTGIKEDNEIWPGDALAFESLLRRLAAYRRVVVLSGETHWGFTARVNYWGQGRKRLTLPPAVRSDLDGDVLTPRLRDAFGAGGFPLSATACLVARRGEEWLVVDPEARVMAMVRDEEDGLTVYDDLSPARIAQFTSSGLKNVVEQIGVAAPRVGFAFSFLGLVSERLIWLDSTPRALVPPEGGRFPPAARHRLATEPVLLPTGNWPVGTRMGPRRPDFRWRLDVVRDERPDDGADPRPPFARAGLMPEFDPADVEGSYRRMARTHTGGLDALRFARGAMHQSNLGRVRFERDGDGLVACHDLFSHPPRRDEAVRVSAYRVPLDGFADEPPRLRFDDPGGEAG
jgi:hypothetical protein